MLRRLVAGLLAALLLFGGVAEAADGGQKIVLLNGQAKPTLDLNFAALGALPSIVSFSRPSSATYYNASGILSTASSGVARFDYDPIALSPRGLLIEEQRTNLALQSNTFSTTWTVTATNASVSSAAGTSPDGTNDAWKLTEATTTSSLHTLAQGFTKSASALAYSASIFGKGAERTRVQILLDDGTNGAAVTVDLSACAQGVAPAAVGTGWTAISASYTPVGQGFCRATLMATTTTSTTLNMKVSLDNGSGTGASSTTYAGTVNSGALVFGAGLEQAGFPTSYIATTTASVTRSIDVATVAVSSFAWKTSAWTFVVEGSGFRLGAVASGRIIGGNGGGQASPLLITNDTTLSAYDHSLTRNLTVSSLAGVTTQKLGAAWDSASGAIALFAAGSGGSDQSFGGLLADNPASLGIGGAGSNEHLGQAWFSRVRIWNRKLPAAQRAALVT